jgi:hypothetical protein
MKLLLLFIVVVGAGAYFYPQQHESTDTVCGALERRLAGLVRAEMQKVNRALPPQLADPRLTALLGQAQAVVPTGMIASAYVREKFPILPPSVGCVAAYWKTMVDPDISQYVMGALPFKLPGR